MKKFKVIYTDCPWKYGFQRYKKNSGCDYPTMTIKELCALPVGQIADDNSLLFHWVTGPKLEEGIQVLNAWGFKYITIAFNWAKRCRVSTDKYFSGQGHYTKPNTELCLLGRKGKALTIIDKTVRQIVDTPITYHSAKPPIVRHNIVRLVGDVPRIELFARERVEGWTTIGNRIDGRDISDVLHNMTYKDGMNRIIA
jgi:N6-adenosine-specific RNA methylase IME4